jgi:hypothetical protein
MSAPRRLAAIAVLIALLAIGGMLLIPYAKNFQFQESLDQIVDHASDADSLRAAAVDRAAALGLPLKGSDIKVIPQPGGGFRADAVYLVRVDIGFYAVDLHFHPSASK